MIYLASASPRRKELLQQIGVEFEQISACVDETPLPGEAPLEYVRRLAQAKAQAGLESLSGMAAAPVLGSDTTVVLAGKILGKPENQQHAIDMLLALSNQTHQVITAVALASSAETTVTHAITEVTFGAISEQEALTYWNTTEPKDKAGAYGIQGLGAVFVKRIEGSYSAVVGLPLYETRQLLKQTNVAVWQNG